MDRLREQEETSKALKRQMRATQAAESVSASKIDGEESRLRQIEADLAAKERAMEDEMRSYRLKIEDENRKKADDERRKVEEQRLRVEQEKQRLEKVFIVLFTLW